MKQKQSVAWFKLSEYIARKEKEKALGIFKLLSYSFFENKAFIQQLEKDILKQCNDNNIMDS